MIDTHTHLYFRETYPDGGLEAVERARQAGVELMVLPSVGLDTGDDLLALHHAAPEGSTATAVGIHPENVDSDWRAVPAAIFDRFADESPVAVGEVGVDLYHDATWRLQQMDCFGYQLERAREMNLPVVIHCREALDEVLEIIGNFNGSDRPRLLFHSFTQDAEAARRIIDAVPDALFGINGVVTFKNAPALQAAVAEIGMPRIVFETDAPYLAPVPLRGRVNESSYLCHIRDKVAALTGVSPEEAERVSTDSARALFRL